MSEERISSQCEECGADVTFAREDAGSVQECPACGSYVDVPDADESMPVGDGATSAEIEQAFLQKQLEKTMKQQDQYQQQLDKADQLAEAQEALWERVTALVERWEKLADRAETILGQYEEPEQAEG